jgi:hypothetical protein
MLLIKGNKDEIYLSITLEDVINQLSGYESYKWCILWVEGVSRNINIIELEREINDSKQGKEIFGKDLLPLFKKFDQVLELLLIGDEDENKLKRYEEHKEMKQECEFVIELVDSSYWEVTSKNVQFNDNLIKNLGAEEATY